MSNQLGIDPDQHPVMILEQKPTLRSPAYCSRCGMELGSHMHARVLLQPLATQDVTLPCGCVAKQREVPKPVACTTRGGEQLP